MKRRIVATIFLWWMVGLHVNICTAEEAAVKLKEVVVTADRIESSAGETTSDITVIKGDEIKKRNAQFVPDVLREVPDINIVQNGGPGQLTGVFLRGAAPTQVLVMIDGIKVKSTTSGSFDLSGIIADDIERIEIVKGSQSTLYGSEAMAGVVNIITKKGSGPPNVQATVEAGSFNTSNSSLSVSGGGEKSGYRVTGSYLNTDGISAAKQGTERDGYRNASVSGKIGFKPLDKLELEFTGKYYHDRAELDGFDFITRQPADDPNYLQFGDHSIASARAKVYLFDVWEQVLTASSVLDSLKARDGDTAFNNYDIKTGVDTVDWQHNLFLSDMSTLTAGVEYRKEKGENKGIFDRSIDNTAWYLNDRVKLAREKLVLNAGLRYDDNEAFGSKTTYRVGALYDIPSITLKIKSNYGTGFRAPTFNELFYPGFENPNLKPEESRTWDIGLDKSALDTKFIFSISYFEQKYKNLIDFDPSWRAANIARAEVNGIETGVAARLLDQINIKAGYTYLDAKDKDTGQRLTRRPANKLTLISDYSTEDVSIIVSYALVGQRYDSAAQRNLASYNLVNVSGNYHLSKRVTLFARADNVFNVDYEEAAGYGTPGFSVFGGIKLSSL